MDTNGGEEIEYDSDPEEAKRSLTMRRREASDDEDGDSDGSDRAGISRRALVHSVESDGEGGAGAYYDEDEEEFDSLGDEEEVYDDYEDEANIRVLVDEGRAEVIGNGERGGADRLVVNTDVKESVEGSGRNVECEDEKVVEPFSVPTAGAFYMHDDRFRPMDGSGGRHRRGRGARMLWQSKDNRKWGHDKFEELNQNKEYQERRRPSRGRYRGRGGRPRAVDHEHYHGHDYGYDGRSRVRPFEKNQVQGTKSVRGRGPTKYERARKNSREPPKQYKQSWNPVEKTSQAESKTTSAPPTTAEPASVPSRKQTFASSLSYASPPFYPSGSIGNVAQKKDVQSGSVSRNLPLPQGSFSLKGKNKVDSIGMDNLNINDGSSAFRGHLQSSLTGSSSNQPRGSVQSWVPQPSKIPNQVSGSLDSSVVSEKMEHYELGKPKGGTLAMNEKGGRSANGIGPSLVYGVGASGDVAVGQGDQNFPALLPVMHFGSQHPGGIGLQPIGMAFPGYLGSPQSGIANSEMTWLPVLAGAGAFGSTYHPPYLTSDGSCHALPSGRPSSGSASRKENGANMADNERNPAHEPEAANNETAQPEINPNKQPRRYSKMSFSK